VNIQHTTGRFYLETSLQEPNYLQQAISVVSTSKKRLKQFTFKELFFILHRCINTTWTWGFCL